MPDPLEEGTEQVYFLSSLEGVSGDFSLLRTGLAVVGRARLRGHFHHMSALPAPWQTEPCSAFKPFDPPEGSGLLTSILWMRSLESRKRK